MSEKTAKPHYDPGQIRADNPIPEVLRARDVVLKESTRAKGGNKWFGCCPIHHGDNKKAFSVTSDGRLWYCRTGCQRGGDVIDLVMALDGLSFPKACEALGGKGESIAPLPRPKQLQPPPAPTTAFPTLDRAKRQEMETIACRLADDDELCTALAHSRGEAWEPVTLRALAYTNALGWLDQCPGADGGLCFIYPNAIKVRGLWREGDTWRWHRGDGSKQIAWLWKDWSWNAAELWREDRLRLLLRTDAAVTEGEPDAIRLINAGAETHARTICAIPSAGIGKALLARMPELLGGLNVTYFADPDEPGLKAAVKIRETIAPRVARLAIKHLAP